MSDLSERRLAAAEGAIAELVHRESWSARELATRALAYADTALATATSEEVLGAAAQAGFRGAYGHEPDTESMNDDIGIGTVMEIVRAASAVLLAPLLAENAALHEDHRATLAAADRLRDRADTCQLHSQQLSAQLATLRQENERLRVGKLANEALDAEVERQMATLRQRLAEAMTDVERMDWLEARPELCVTEVMHEIGDDVLIWRQGFSSDPSLRAEIDARRQHEAALTRPASGGEACSPVCSRCIPGEPCDPECHICHPAAAARRAEG